MEIGKINFGPEYQRNTGTAIGTVPKSVLRTAILVENQNLYDKTKFYLDMIEAMIKEDAECVGDNQDALLEKAQALREHLEGWKQVHITDIEGENKC